MPNRFTKLRLIILSLVGLSVIYRLAVSRGLIPTISTLAALAHPITCPADPTIHTAPSTDKLLNSNQSLTQLLPNNVDRQQISILIEKSRYRLTVYYNQQPIKSYAVVFGKGKGDKRREGDYKTPEGILKVRDKYPHPDWSKFIWLDYPNAQSRCKHQRSKQRGEIPFWSSVGSEIGIHGGPSQGDSMVDSRINWTWGCPSMKNRDIDELYPLIQVGTIVEIVA